MRKWIVFLFAFIVLYFVCHFTSGILLTAWYTPNLTEAWQASESLPSNVVFSGPVFFPTFLLAAIAAAGAFFIAAKVKRSA
ncbi:hypothetical protein M2M59_07430 [Rummeliibacillus sp. G93]|uniref:hypothetical protein n=1 Tax=Rummeliibacillus TaxID=648802 RepID=UPI00201BAF37|nr:hypothetical protein [Rummeliibacillus sp. G93]UQW98836.1 hypothetical protein M2M59_07430 [Rummeliibacillus sp. G93]